MASCVWKGVAYSECNLTGVRFFHTPLAGVDLTTCRLEELILSDAGEELRRWR